MVQGNAIQLRDPVRVGVPAQHAVPLLHQLHMLPDERHAAPCREHAVLTVEDRSVLPLQWARQVIPGAAAQIFVGRNHRQIGKRVQDAVERKLIEDDRPIDLPDRRLDRDAAWASRCPGSDRRAPERWRPI